MQNYHVHDISMCIYTDTHTHTLTSKEHLQQASSHHLYLHMQLHIIHLKIIREIQEEKFNHQIINTHIYVYISYFFKKEVYIYIPMEKHLNMSSKASLSSS